MGFWDDDIGAKSSVRRKSGEPSDKLLHDLECKACPLNRVECNSPKMEPTGNENPDILMLGPAPNGEDDGKGQQFAGQAGRYLRPHIPDEWSERLLWDNVTRCYSSKAVGGPQHAEIECCRPRHVELIERTRPSAIFGYGGAALGWVIGEQTITNWRGRHLPIKVGDHTCWYFPFHHPLDLIRNRGVSGLQRTDDEHMFEIDMRNAWETLLALPEPVVHTREQALADIDIILNCTHDDALRVVRFLKKAALERLVGVDYETSHLRPYAEDASIASVAVSTSQSTLAFPLDHPETRWSSADLHLVVDALLEFFKAPNVRKAVHNLAFEQEWTGVTFGLEYLRASEWDDTLSQAFVLDQRQNEARKKIDDDDGGMEIYGLGFLTRLYFGVDIKQLSNVDRKSIMKTPLKKLLPYNAVDAKYHRLVCIEQDREIAAIGLTHVYENHRRRISTCVLTQIKGVPLDLAEADRLEAKYVPEIARLEKAILSDEAAKKFFRRTGQAFQPSSNTDMAVLCRDVLKSDAGRTRLGGYRVDEATLLKIKHPIIKPVLDYRTVSKSYSTYCFTRSKPVVWPDGLLHPLLNTVKARTSRLSCSDPNGQNWPKRDEGQKEIRRQIAARPGFVLVSLDYGQIEARLFAMASKDKNYMELLWADFDIHREWAERIAYEFPAVVGGKQFIKDNDSLKKFREKVKGGWVFALFFGAKLGTACLQVGIEEGPQARRLLDQFWQQFPGVQLWVEETRRFYEIHGYVELLTGRRRCGPMKPNAVINTPIQGTATGEIIMDGMNRVSEMELLDGLVDHYKQPFIQIHDDLEFELPEDRVEEYVEPIVREMLRPTFDFINVPLMVEMAVGPNLYEMVSVDKLRSDFYYDKSEHRGLLPA